MALGEPPPGIDLYADRGPVKIAPVIATYVIAVIAVGLRFYSRVRVQAVRIAADDWLIAAALLVLSAGFALVVVASGNPGLGKHIWVVPHTQAEDVMHTLFAFVLLYLVSNPLIKLSILLFYRRIFGMTNSMWFYPNGGRCVYDIYKFYISYAAVNVATDVSILMVPMPIVWKLQMPRTQKILVCGILLIGGLCVNPFPDSQVHLTQKLMIFLSVCVTSFVRIYYIHFLRAHDYTWVVGNVFLWSSIEPSIGILCACLPTLHPMIRSVISRVFGISSNRYDSKKQETTNKRTIVRRQRPLDWDETLLTTRDVQVEMSGVRREYGEDGQITVDMDFRIVEESNQLNKR
ncbi:hypothetical protein PDIG_51500 [Penicillium digitatum PHI26]|uniref:Rhodopsin domain-containing protein n=2 Tax=Penicillium digitatum TaxID=36651 RepID=K9G8Y9_PEND2|nr:hypothetical protein PDIP_20700 [Penicillium digitatum Pd1]EKV11313.1 hypothetical protein PDIG_51500 [Penicillium digitatum PHI26]EKV20044.1 hypothetical protein PDIP_20700 [Penicillium digitatum Pd1]